MGPNEQTNTTESAPWGPAQGALKGLLAKSKSLGGKTSLFRPEQGQTTQDALEAAKAVGHQGSSALPHVQNVVGGATGAGFQSGVDALTQSADGDMLSGNPHLRALLDYASDDARDRINQNFSAMGRYGSGAHSEVLARELGNISTRALFDDYNNERDRQLSSAGQLYSGGFQGAALAPQIDQSRLFGSDVLNKVGAQEDAYALAKKQAPLRGLEWQSGFVNPIASMGQITTATERTDPNVFGQILGGGMMAGGLLTGNPMAAMGGLTRMADPYGGGF